MFLEKRLMKRRDVATLKPDRSTPLAACEHGAGPVSCPTHDGKGLLGLWACFSLQVSRPELLLPWRGELPPCLLCGDPRRCQGLQHVVGSTGEPRRRVQHVPTLLQLSASPAVGCTGPALNPTSASARKAGTGGTAIKVSENQPPESMPGLLLDATQKWRLPEPFHHHQEHHPPLFSSSLIPTIKQRFSILHYANYFKKTHSEQFKIVLQSWPFLSFCIRRSRAWCQPGLWVTSCVFHLWCRVGWKSLSTPQ